MPLGELYFIMCLGKGEYCHANLRLIDYDVASSRCTPLYRAPELFNHPEANPTMASDMVSLGLTLLELLLGDRVYPPGKWYNGGSGTTIVHVCC
jgi:serine/threonine protein kinase